MPGAPPLHLPQLRPDAVTQAIAQAVIDTQTQDASDAQAAIADAVAKATAPPVPILAPPVGNTPTYNQTTAPAPQQNIAPLILVGLGVAYYLWKKGIL